MSSYQIATDAKSNEITAVPKLLAMLSLKGTIVTADALNCQRTIAQQIVDQGGDYALALKGNQGTLHDDVRTFFNDPASTPAASAQSVDADHGRIETRTATVWTDIEWLQRDHHWPGLAAIGKVVRIRETASKTTTETAYYLLSTAVSATRFNEVVREHWGVENRLHWRLDVVMNEDQDRTRLGNGPHNLAVRRHMAPNIMQKDGSKASLRGKFQRAGWNDAYLSRPYLYPHRGKALRHYRTTSCRSAAERRKWQIFQMPVAKAGVCCTCVPRGFPQLRRTDG